MGRVTPVIRSTDGSTKAWKPTTLDRMGKTEQFLEDAIFEEPRLLDLESVRTGIHRPLVGFRQLSLASPQGRSIRPDIVFLSASGHVIVVEVKRGINPELKERQVLAQILDYAGVFASMDVHKLFTLFSSSDKGNRKPSDWHGWVESLFPDAADSADLADMFLHRLHKGEIHLCIACDKSPIGTTELLAGVARQSSLGFDLSLVEIGPYVSDDNPDEVLFIPETTLRTEIVGRTVVKVEYLEGTPRPKVMVTAEPFQDESQGPRTATHVDWHRGRTPVTNAFEVLREEMVEAVAASELPELKIYKNATLWVAGEHASFGRYHLHVVFPQFVPDTENMVRRPGGVVADIMLGGKRDTARRLSTLKDWMRALRPEFDRQFQTVGEYAHEDKFGWELVIADAATSGWTSDLVSDVARRVLAFFKEARLFG